MELCIYITAILICIFYEKIYKKNINSFTTIILPYVVILFLNNTIATKFYFKKINSDTQYMILQCMIFFFIGSILGLFIMQNAKKKNNNEEKIAIEKTVPYVIIVLVLRFIELLRYYINYGISGMINNDFKLLISRGLIAHLLLSIFPLMMIYFYHWLKNKNKKRYLILFLIYTFYSFIETEKAQIISLILSTYIYCSVKDKKYLKKGLIIIFPLIATVFIGNYLSKFILQGFAKNVDGSYYTYRLWCYISGGIINSNLITSSKVIATNAFDYMLDILSAFPDMITNRLFGIKLGGQVAAKLPYIKYFPTVTTISTGFKAQTSNVVSTMTMAYGNGNIIAFAIFSILWGCISEMIFLKMNITKDDKSTMFYCCYITFSVLSFFGSYYTISSFVERFIWCYILGIIFDKRFKIKWKNNC